MKLMFNKKHLQKSVSVSALLGMSYGYWLGARAKDASAYEVVLILIGFVIVSYVAMGVIDKIYLPKSTEHDE